MFRIRPEDLAKLPIALRYAYYVMSCVRLVPYGTWKEDGEPNPFVAPRKPKSPATRQEASLILEDIDPFEILADDKTAPDMDTEPQGETEPERHTLKRSENGLVRPAHLRKRRYAIAA